MLKFIRIVFIGFFWVLAGMLHAQTAYTDPIYAYRVEEKIYYGTAINYAGYPVDLYLDLYKPLGDENQHRPVLIIAFGGAWVAGARNSQDVMPLIPWFVKRGYVVASIDYRLGMHTSPAGGSNAATCSLMEGSANCVNVADSNEVIRANYRAMQDVKGAIRFLKGRSESDSTCRENYYLAGVSAGGFNTMAAAFVTNEAEKPFAAGALSDAPKGATSLDYCHSYFNPPDSAIHRERPDLGSIEGSIALNGESSRVQGMANFFGGMIWNFMEDSREEDAPLLYLYHKTSDIIVSCGRSPLLSQISYDCLDPLGFLGCKHVWNMPWSWGSCAIKTLIDKEQYPISYYNSLKNTGGSNCLENPPGHSYQNAEILVKEITDFFSTRIMERENNGCALVTGHNTLHLPSAVKVSPNPFSQQLNIQCTVDVQELFIADLSGRKIKMLDTTNDLVNIESLPAGVYFLCYKGFQGEGALKLLKSE